MLIPALAFIFATIHRHYEQVAIQLSLDDFTPTVPGGHTVLVLVGDLQRSVVKAIEYAQLLSPSAKGVYVEDLTVVMLDRPRHDKLIAEVRRAGARIKLIGSGDVSAALATTKPDTGIDILMGIGGAPQGILAAAALGRWISSLLFGVAIGNILRGIPLSPDGEYAGTFFTLLNPFAVVTGVLTVAALAPVVDEQDADRLALGFPDRCCLVQRWPPRTWRGESNRAP